MNSKYVLITCAHNEEDNIKKIIDSVLSQTVLPFAWIIISDRSNDGTDDIVGHYAQKNKFIEFYSIFGETSHNFCGKVNALNLGISKLEGKDYNFLGIIDADLSFSERYFENLLNKFVENSNLGIAGGNLIQYVNGKFINRMKSLNSVGGGVKFFRRECFNDTEGFIPLEHGGEDAAIEIMARMKGWEVWTFPEIEAIHYGYIGNLIGKKWKERYRFRYRRGLSYYFLGYHALFHTMRCVYRLFEKPYIIGSLFELASFFYSRLMHRQTKLPDDVVSYLRKEQMQRIKDIFFKPFLRTILF